MHDFSLSLLWHGCRGSFVRESFVCHGLISITRYEIRYLKALYDGGEEFAKGIRVNLRHCSTMFVELVDGEGFHGILWAPLIHIFFHV